MDYGAIFDSYDSHGETIFHKAIKLGSFEIVKSMVIYGADTNFKTKYGKKTPLHLAIEGGDNKIALFLMGNGAKIQTIDGGGDTPLNVAIQKGNLQMAATIIRAGADVKRTNSSEVSPLTLIAKTGSIELARIVIQMPGAVKKNTVVLRPQKCGSGKANELVETRTILPYVDEYKEMLTSAAEAGQSDMVAFLLDHGFNVNLRNHRGYTALQLAARKGKLETCKILIERGAKINKGSYTPLHYAAMSGELEVVKFLLENGADPCRVTYRNETPQELAKEKKAYETVKFLRKYQCKVRHRQDNSPFDFDEVERSAERIPLPAKPHVQPIERASDTGSK